MPEPIFSPAVAEHHVLLGTVHADDGVWADVQIDGVGRHWVPSTAIHDEDQHGR